MNILGLHFGHDAGACIVKNGKLVVAISSERITRVKKQLGFNNDVLNYVLKAANLTIDEIDVIAFAEFFEEHVSGTAKLFIGGQQVPIFLQQIFGNQVCQCEIELMGRRIPAFSITHHLAHCASSFYTSPFSSSFCFSMDSSTGHTAANSLVCYGDGNKLVAINCPKLMIGNAYTMFTHNLGIGNPLYKAGSTMGLASYGHPVKQVLDNIKSYVDRSFMEQENVFDDVFRAFWKEITGSHESFDPKNKDSKISMNVAASIQYIFEESILKAISQIENGGNENICLSGGSMLNCNVNSRILKESKFKNVHLFPGCGDDGICVGSALYLAHHIFNFPRYNYKNKDICYLGDTYTDECEPDYKFLAKQISSGKIVGWFCGGSEYGPRALGHRSILADPRNFHNREILNFVTKKREWFRPFAPVVLKDKSQEYFDFNTESPFMLFTAQVKQPKEVPSITHIDNTARMQTIDEETNPNYFRMVNEFYNQTSIPMLINTSLNADGQPILETPDDAQEFFKKSQIDIMVINGKILEK